MELLQIINSPDTIYSDRTILLLLPSPKMYTMRVAIGNSPPQL